MLLEQKFHLPDEILSKFKQNKNLVDLKLKTEESIDTITSNCKLEYYQEELDLVEKISAKISLQYSKAIIIAIGGSMSSSQAFTACKNYQSNNFTLTYSNSLAIDKQEAVFTKENLQNSAIIIISRSGESAEILNQVYNITNKYKQFFGPNYALGDHFYIITQGPNFLTDFGSNIRANIFNYISKSGKFSTFSLVGLLPARLIGLLPKEIILSALQVLKFPQNAIDAAYINYELLNLKYNINILLHYNDLLEKTLLRQAQTASEIIAKDNRGFTPLVTGISDQHGLWQLFLTGPSDKYFTLLRTKKSDYDPELNYLIEDTYYKLNLKSLKRKSIPIRELIIDKIDSASLGALSMHLLLETILLANIMNVSSTTHPDIDKNKKLLSKIFLTKLKNIF
ncbi:MAG: hypothetical protein WBJ81_01965 [Rickettsiales bacterium]